MIRFIKKLHVFVGELINGEEIIEDDDCYLPFDYGSNFTYKVIKNLYGNYDNKEINFNAYEHSRIVPFDFSNTKYALLFVLQHCENKYTLHKYQGYNVYKTSNNRFAIRYMKSEYFRKGVMIMTPEEIDFGELSFYLSDRALVEKHSLEPYYDIKGNKAIPKMGNYVEDFFSYWKTIDNYKLYFD